MFNSNPAVDEFITKLKKWQDEITLLRTIVLDCGLAEELKWRQPCYNYNKTNMIILGGFKHHCIISFFKGALLHDENNLLEKPGENTQGVRWIKFTSVNEIITLTPIIKQYIFEAIEIEKAGLTVEPTDNNALIFPEELIQKFKENKPFEIAFDSLTPGRQRAYNMFFTASKQAKTREARIEKYTQRILNGKGINDCTCGLSKKMPSCDGSHKYLEK
jgi:uncharacterized protein YdeI (YjbR/CyaY-like superfamily)